VSWAIGIPLTFPSFQSLLNLFSHALSQSYYPIRLSMERRRRAPEITWRIQGHHVHITSFISLFFSSPLFNGVLQGNKDGHARKWADASPLLFPYKKQDKVFSLTCPPYKLLALLSSLYLLLKWRGGIITSEMNWMLERRAVQGGKEKK